MPASPSPSHGEPVRRPRRRTAASILAGVFVRTGRLAAADAPPPAGDAAGITVGSTCPRMELDCADGRIATCTLTVDARIEQAFGLGTRRLALVAEAFNLPGLRHEVEENPVWGAAFRDPTAVQPPRVVRLGARFDV